MDPLAAAMAAHNQRLASKTAPDHRVFPKHRAHAIKLGVPRPEKRDEPDPWIIEEGFAAALIRIAPWMRWQLMDRGFIDAQGRPSRLWRSDPRNIPQRS